RTGFPFLRAGSKRQSSAASIAARVRSSRAPFWTVTCSGTPSSETRTFRITSPRTRSFSARSGYSGITRRIGSGALSRSSGGAGAGGAVGGRVGVTVRVRVGRGVTVRVGEGDGVAVRVAVRVGDGDGVAVRVGDGEGVEVRVEVGRGVRV